MKAMLQALFIFYVVLEASKNRSIDASMKKPHQGKPGVPQQHVGLKSKGG